MRTHSKIVAGIASTALVLTSSAPALARPWGPPPPYYRHRGSDAGAVIGTIAAVGIVAAIVAAASNRNRAPVDRGYDRSPPPYDGPVNDPRYDNRAVGQAYDPARTDPAGQETAVDACAIAARDEGTRGGGFAEVREITGVSPLGSGWDVTGRIEARPSYRSNDGEERGFRCAYQSGRVSAVSLD